MTEVWLTAADPVPDVVRTPAHGALFAGPGEMRRLCREFDWAAGPLGAVDSWPSELQTAVRIMLGSGFPIMVNWGPQLIAIYNDAFAPLLGGKHPMALGRAPREVWAESWDFVGPRLARVATDGETLQSDDERQMLERNGYPEECFFTSSSSPIFDAAGRIAGMLTVTTETTGKMLGERRMGVVRELGALSATDSANMADACRAVLHVLGRTRESVPFAVAFLRENDTPPVKVADYGLAADGCVGGLTEIGDGGPAGVVGQVIGSGESTVLSGLRELAPGALLAGPLGPLPPDEAVVVPLTVSGRTDPVGALVLGVNPYRPLDDDYRAFFTLVGRQVRVALTDAAAYESERNRAQVLADLDRAKMEFFQNVSHELRTPLTLLLAPLQDLLSAVPDQSGAAKDLQAAVRAAERLRRMVDALLDFSGAEARTLVPNREPIDLGGVTADVASMFRSTAQHAGLDFVVDVPVVPITALVDRAMWATVLTNLLSNAVKYTPAGRVEVRLRAVDATAELTVSDTGSGIPEQEQGKVFERFYRRPAGATGPGAGIGLALVADLVRVHQGHVDLRSDPGRGTTFTISLPLGATPDPVRDGVPLPPQGGDEERPRLLLIEDDGDLRSYLGRLLASDGWAVDAVADAETALARSDVDDSAAPDIVVTDIMLPGRSGLHLVREFRRASPSSRVPIIILTARGGDDAASEGLAAGADDYITKPFSSRELLARVRSNHELHQLRERAVGVAEYRAERIRTALESNRVIGTAVGILMAAYQVTATQGFELLVKASQDGNRKLRDIAADVVETGSLPFRQTTVDDLLQRVLGAGR